MRCLVVGGNGFVGSHLVDELVAQGYEVSVLDRFSVGVAYFQSENVERHIGDFLNVADLAAALEGIDYLFHYLSTTTPATAEDDPMLDIRTNVVGSVELFREASRAGVKRIYFASTGGAIYGDQGLGAYAESVAPAPTSPYAIGKLAIEGYLRYFESMHGIETVSFRISNPYGPRQKPTKRQGVIPIFLREVMAGRPITVYGDGSMVRDYVYVGDAAKMMAQTVDSNLTHSVLNIGSGVGYTIDEVIRTIADVTAEQIDIRYVDSHPTFVNSVVLDTSRYSREVGPVTTVKLDEGIAKTWADMQAQRSEN